MSISDTLTTLRQANWHLDLRDGDLVIGVPEGMDPDPKHVVQARRHKAQIRQRLHDEKYWEQVREAIEQVWARRVEKAEDCGDTSPVKSPLGGELFDKVQGAFLGDDSAGLKRAIDRWRAYWLAHLTSADPITRWLDEFIDSGQADLLEPFQLEPHIRVSVPGKYARSLLNDLIHGGEAQQKSAARKAEKLRKHTDEIQHVSGSVSPEETVPRPSVACI